MNKYNQTGPAWPPVPPAPSYSEKSFLHTTAAAVVVPVLQSIVIALAMGIASFVVLLRFGMYVKDAILNSATVAAIVLVVSIIYLLKHWLILTIEKTFDIDIPGMGYEPPPPKPETVIRIDKISGGGSFEQKRYTFPVTEEQVEEFCNLTLDGTRPISRRAWVPKRNGFSDGEWRAFWAQLVRYQLVEPDGEGYNFTEAGEDWARGYLQERGHPSPSESVDMPENPPPSPTHPPTHP